MFKEHISPAQVDVNAIRIVSLRVNNLSLKYFDIDK